MKRSFTLLIAIGVAGMSRVPARLRRRRGAELST